MMNYFSIAEKMKIRIATSLVVVLVAFTISSLVPNTVEAAFNPQINYQGRLLDSLGDAVPDGVYHMTFRLYTSPTGGVPIWTEDRSTDLGDRATITNGLFSIMLGSSTPFTVADFDQPLYLSVEIGGSGGAPSWDGEMTPRKPFGAVPAAFVAATLEGLTASQFLRSDMLNSGATFTNTTTTSATTTNLYIGSSISGAGLASCAGGADKLLWDATSGQFSCGLDSGAGGGITGIRAQFSPYQTGASQTFATSSPDANLRFTITSSGDTHTFNSSWTGTLAGTRGGTGISSVTDGGLLIGGAGNTWSQVSTSTLNINTNNLVEGSNLFYTDGRVQTYLDTLNKGYFFSTTSSLAHLNTLDKGYFFSTTSANYWETQQSRYDTTDFQTDLAAGYNAIFGNSTTTNATTTNLSLLGSLYTSLTQGSVPFIGSNGRLSQDNSNFFWDDTNKRLGIGTTIPSASLSVSPSSSSGTADAFTGSSVFVTDTGAVSTGFDLTTGDQVTVNRSGATGGTLVNYGNLVNVNGTMASGTGAITNYGSNISVVGNTVGTSNNFGLYVSASGADNNYAAVFAAGNVGIGDVSPASALTVGSGELFQVTSTGLVINTVTLTDTSSIYDVNLTLGNDGNVDTISGINVDVTSANTGDADVVYGINIGNLTSANATVLERALRIGSGWDEAIDVNGTLISLAELQALDGGIDLTSEITGILPLANGGTNKNLTASNGSIIYSDADSFEASAVGVSGQALISGGAGAPTWFAPTLGSVLFAGTSGALAQDNANFFWDDTNNRFGIGTTTPLAKLDVVSTLGSTGDLFNVSSTTAASTVSSIFKVDYTGLTTAQNLLLTGSSTLQNLTFTNATGTNATTTNLFSTTGRFTNLCLTGDVCVTNWPVTGVGTESKWATSTLSTTSIYTAGATRVGIGTSSPSAALDVTGFVDNSATISLRDSSGNIALEFRSATSSLLNTSIGVSALDSNTTGSLNTALGYGTLSGNLSGSNNSAFGYNSLLSNTIGDDNVAIGLDALLSNTEGNENVSVGNSTLLTNDLGSNNAAFGHSALYFNYDGDSNVAFGSNALLSNTSGSNNIAIGTLAASSLSTGSNNIAIGYNIDLPSNTASNQLSIGNLIFGTGIDGSGTGISSGNIGIGIATPTEKLHVSGNLLVTGNSTTTNATTTNLFSTTGRFTNLFGNTANLTESGNLFYTDGRVQTYLDTLNKGYFFSTTSSLAHLNTLDKGYFFSTTSANYWETQQSRYDTTDFQTDLAAGYNAIFGNSTTTNATTTNLFSTTGTFTNLCLTGDTCITSWPIDGIDSKWATSTNGLAIYPNSAQALVIGATATSSSARLTLENTISADGATTAIAGMQGIYTFNPTAGGVQVGDRLTVTNSPTTAANTAVGQIVRMVDSSSLANLVRGLDITASGGNNTLGVNTGVRSVGHTFGIQGVTTGLAGGTFAPAAIYGENIGTTNGDILRLYSDTVTTAPSLATFYQASSTYSGIGLLMDLGNPGVPTTGAFTGKFADFRNSGTSVFNIDSTGKTGIGTTTPYAKLSVSGTSGQTNSIFEVASSTHNPLFIVSSNGNVSATNLVSCGGIQTNAAGTMSCTSDASLKDIKGEFSSGLDAITQISPQFYSWKEGTSLYDGGVDYFGFIAQDVENALPQAVNIGANGQRQINTTTILAATINAIKELKILSDINTEIASSTQVELSAVVSAIGLDLTSDLSGLSIDREVTLNSGLRVDRIASIADLVLFESDVEFVGRPYFNSDTGGLAVIEAGDRRVDIVFEESYIDVPVVNATLSLSVDSSESEVENILGSDVRYVVTDRSEDGFSIILSAPAPEKMEFSWIALAIKDMKISNSSDSEDASEDSGSSEPVGESGSGSTEEQSQIETEDNSESEEQVDDSEEVVVDEAEGESEEEVQTDSETELEIESDSASEDEAVDVAVEDSGEDSVGSEEVAPSEGEGI